MTENKGLLFIPDISGFTQFVNSTEIEHSRLIVQELLEILINSNQLGLEVSEIEGDAILFYKFGEPPDLKDLYKQVEKMFREFHKHLLAYDHKRYCHCNACNAAIELSIKVITHYGEFTTYNVKNFNKLIGKDVIVAHQLLKNEIEHHEYWLITPSISEKDNLKLDLAEWMKWNSSTKKTESGEIAFHYAQLSELKNEITPEPFQQLMLSEKIKMLSFSKEYETDIITLFHATGDFNNRSRWFEGIRAVEEVNHFLPRVGMKCRCVLENGETYLYSSSYSYSEERIEFSETDEKKNSTTYFILEKTGDKKTNLKIDFYMPKNIIEQTIFKLKEKKKMEEAYQRSLQNLKMLIKEIVLPAL